MRARSARGGRVAWPHAQHSRGGNPRPWGHSDTTPGTGRRHQVDPLFLMILQEK